MKSSDIDTSVLFSEPENIVGNEEVDDKLAENIVSSATVADSTADQNAVPVKRVDYFALLGNEKAKSKKRSSTGNDSSQSADTDLNTGINIIL